MRRFWDSAWRPETTGPWPSSWPASPASSLPSSQRTAAGAALAAPQAPFRSLLSQVRNHCAQGLLHCGFVCSCESSLLASESSESVSIAAAIQRWCRNVTFRHKIHSMKTIPASIHVPSLLCSSATGTPSGEQRRSTSWWGSAGAWRGVRTSTAAVPAMKRTATAQGPRNAGHALRAGRCWRCTACPATGPLRMVTCVVRQDPISAMLPRRIQDELCCMHVYHMHSLRVQCCAKA